MKEDHIVRSALDYLKGIYDYLCGDGISASPFEEASSSGGGISLSADYKSPGDFTVSYGGTAKTLSLSGLPTTLASITSLDIVYIKVKPRTGDLKFIINGIDDTFALSSVVNGNATLSVTNDEFLNNDEWEVGINGAVSNIKQLKAIETDIETLQTKTSLSGISMPANFFSPIDFAVTFSNATQLTVSGAPFAVNDSNCFVLSVMVKDSTGAWTKYVNGANGVSIKADSDNTITIAGHTGTAFAATDLAYRVAINYQQKAFDPSTNTMMVIEQAPNRAAYVQDSISDGTNVADGTTYDLSMDGYKDLSLTGYLIDGVGETTTMTVWATNDEDYTNDATNGLHQIYGYDAINNTLVNSVSATNQTTKFALDFDNLNFSTIRIKIATSAATNTVNIKARRKA